MVAGTGRHPVFLIFFETLPFYVDLYRISQSLAPFWFPFGALWLTFDYLWLPFDALWLAFGVTFDHPWTRFSLFWNLLASFFMFDHMFYEDHI